MSLLMVVATALEMIPAVNTLLNLFLLRTPPMPGTPPRVAILIPARDEESTIGKCIDAALASEGADVEVIVLDDGSSDATLAIVRDRASRDPRVHAEIAPPLPRGWAGKNHACHILAGLTDRPYLLFVDADVRLAPHAAARLVPRPGIDLVSGVPRQRVKGVVEAAVIPMINSLIYGYLPVYAMRLLPASLALTAACGQLLMVRASAYRATGGHGAVADRLHDGLLLARNFRRMGYRTDLADATTLATCRMYETPRAVWRGFSKNATEGMAKPAALPVWTVLLAGGHLLPWIMILAMEFAPPEPVPAAALITVTGLLAAARTGQAIKCREPVRALLLHPLGIVLTLAIQWNALFAGLRGTAVDWRGRTYLPHVR